MKTILKPLYRKLIFILLLIYAIAGFIVVPYLIQSNFTSIIKEQLNTDGYIKSVYINPFSGELVLNNLLIQDDKNNTLLYIKKLDLNFEFTHLLLGNIQLKHLFINGLKSSITLYKNQQFNFQHIVTQLSQKNDSEKNIPTPKDQSITPLIGIDILYLKDTRISFIDQSKSKEFSLHSKPFKLKMLNISTKKNSISTFKTDIEILNTLNLNLNSKITLVPLIVDGNLKIQNIMLKKIYNYLEDDLKFKFSGLIKNISTSFQIKQSNNQFNGKINDLNIDIPSFQFHNNRFDINTSNLKNSIQSIEIIKNKELKFDLNTISLSNEKINFTDIEKNKNNTLIFQNLLLNVDQYSSKNTDKSNITLSLVTPKNGNLNLVSQFIQKPFTIKGKAIIKDFSIVPYQDYIKDFINLDIKSTLMNSQLNFDITDTTQNIQANVDVYNIDLYHSKSQEALFKLKKLNIKNIQYTNNNLQIDKVTLDTFITKFQISKDKSTNIDNLLIPSKEDKTPQTDRSPFQYFIKNLEIKNGLSEFSDHSLPLNFDTNIHELSANIDDISSKDEETNIELNGLIEKYGLAKITAKTILANFKNKTDVSVDFKNIDVRSFSPYSGKFIGQKIDEGRLSLNLNYTIRNSKLSSTNNVKIKKLTLGDSVNSKEALNLPIGLAIALLEDSDNLIDLDIPISGDMSNPQFKLAGVIWKALGNIITNVATAPFRFLGSLLGMDSDELGKVEFSFGSDKIIAPEKEKLDKLIQLLSKKKNLQITLQPAYDKKNDMIMLINKKFQELLTSKDKDLSLQDLYIQIFGENKFEDIEKNTKKEELSSLLTVQIKNTIEITTLELETLAKKRVQHIVNYFVSNKLTLDRIQIKNEVKDENSKDEIFSLQLELNIKDK